MDCGDPDVDDYDQGILDVKAEVTGSGTWVVADVCHVGVNYPNGCAVEIRINAAMTGLTGDVLVYNGTFLVRENFTTQGNFMIMDDGAIGTKPQVIVREGHVARFNVEP